MHPLHRADRPSGGSLILLSLSAGARPLQGRCPRLSGKPGRFAWGEVPRPLIPRRLRSASRPPITAARQRKAMPCPFHQSAAIAGQISIPRSPSQLGAVIKARSRQARAALTQIVRPAVHAGQRGDEERLKRHQRHQPVAGFGAEGLHGMGDLPPVARDRHIGAQVHKSEKSSRRLHRSSRPSSIRTTPVTTASAVSSALLRVFDAAPVDSYSAPAAPEPLGPIERIAAADRLVSTTQARIKHGGDGA